MVILWLYLTILVARIHSWNFYFSENEYTWSEAVNNPPCHIVGMNTESQDAFVLANHASDMPDHGKFWVYAHFNPKPIFSEFCYEVGTYDFIGNRIKINRNIVQTCFDRCPSDFLLTLNYCYCKDIHLDLSEYHTCVPISCFESTDKCGRSGTNKSEPCVGHYGKANFSLVFGKNNTKSDNCAVLKVVIERVGTFAFTRLDQECDTKLRVLCYESENVSRITSTEHLPTMIITKKTTRVRTTKQPTRASTALTEDNVVQSTLQNIEPEVISDLPSVPSDKSPHEGTLETPSSTTVGSQTTDKNQITVFLTSVTGLTIISVCTATLITLLLGGIFYIKRRKKTHQIEQPDDTLTTAGQGYVDVGLSKCE